jgi:hypothetical protein
MNRILIPALFLVGTPLLGNAQAPQGVRGKVASMHGTALIIVTKSGNENVHLASGYMVYSRVNSSLAHVKPNSFVGITTVKINGIERASEVHIFPAALKGLGEGSRMMGSNDKAGKPNRMTNGTVRTFGLTKPSRMTNGKIIKETSGGVVVAYTGGSINITIPPNVTVTEIIPVAASKLKVGANVFALGPKQKDGSWLAKTVMITGPSPAK